MPLFSKPVSTVSVLLKEKNKSLRCDLTRAPQAVAPLFGDSGATATLHPWQG